MSAVAVSRSGGRDRAPVRAPVVALLVFLATLPLEWVTIVGAAGGFIKPFHISALALVVVCLARWRPSSLIMPVLRRHAGVYLAYFLLLGVVLLAGLAFADPFLPTSIVFRQVFYAGTSVVVAGLMMLVVGTRGPRPSPTLLAWSGATTVAVLLVGLGTALAAQSVNPVSVVGDALRNADPDVISRQLLRSAFRTDLELAEVATNLRHKVFVGLLVSVFLGLAGLTSVRAGRRLLRAVLGAVAVAGAGLVVVSLSRSTILSLVLTMALVPLGLVVRNRVRPIHMAAAGVVVLLVIGVVVSPLTDLLVTRFEAGESYSARLEAAGPLFLENFEGAALLGTREANVERSPHNLVLHSWLAGGVVAAAAAAVVVLSLAGVWLREAKRYLTGGVGWVIPIGQAWVLGLGVIPLVRAFTAGNQFHMVEWTAIGLFLGLTMANERRHSATNSANVG